MAGSARSGWSRPSCPLRSEEHTSELQSRSDIVCRLLLEKKKKKQPAHSLPDALTDVRQHEDAFAKRFLAHPALDTAGARKRNLRVNQPRGKLQRHLPSLR